MPGGTCQVVPLGFDSHFDQQVDVPAGQRPPRIYASVAAGKKGGLPKDGAHLRYTGAQAMYFTLHSIDILEPLIKNKQHPAWLSWCAHVAYVKLLLAKSFDANAIYALDKAIQTHHDLYAKVPQYKGRFRPKHHFATHFPRDILNCGPGHTPPPSPLLRVHLLSSYCCLCITQRGSIGASATKRKTRRSRTQHKPATIKMSSQRLRRAFRTRRRAKFESGSIR